LGKFLVRHAAFCLTVSDLLKEQLLKDNNNCETIAPMIDFSKNDILTDRNYSNDGVVRCLFVGRVEYRKGIYDLMEAIEILNDQRDDLHFDIVGGGDSFSDLSERFKEIDNVCFKGQISDTNELLAMYRQADLFIFPSHDEGFPRVLYEAMMARVPVITTMVGGIGGFMKDRHNCIAIEAQNPGSIVKAVNEMIDSENLKMQLVNQATQDVLTLFDGSRIKHSKLLINKLEFVS
jgi:glycosyltransferase involved in cell wall biosynthesis